MCDGEYIQALFFSATLNHICSNNSCTSTASPGRKTQFNRPNMQTDSLDRSPTKNHKAYPCSSPATSKEKQQAFVCVCFLTSITDLHLAFRVTTSKLPVMSKDFLWASMLPSTYLNHRIYHVEWKFISLCPPQDCLNSSKMGTKIYWSFKPSFSDPARTILEALNVFWAKWGKRV